MKIAFIGGGHMAHALISGFIQQAEIIVADRNTEKRDALAAEFNIQTVSHLPADAAADIIVLAVRPSQTAAALKNLPAGGLLVSVAAGVCVRQLMQWSGRAAAQTVRVMPNTPVQVKRGMTFGYVDAAASAADKAQVAQLFQSVGDFIWVEQERLLDAATAISGSGPGYIYYIIDALTEAARQLGLDEAAAQTAVLQTMRGACMMIEQNPHTTAAQLCAAVAVPGGTTERALAVMQNAQMRQTLIDAVDACHSRARSIADEFDKANE